MLPLESGVLSLIYFLLRVPMSLILPLPLNHHLGCEVFALDVNEEQLRAAFPNQPNIHFLKVDVSSPEEVQNAGRLPAGLLQSPFSDLLQASTVSKFDKPIWAVVSNGKLSSGPSLVVPVAHKTFGLCHQPASPTELQRWSSSSRPPCDGSSRSIAWAPR